MSFFSKEQRNVLDIKEIYEAFLNIKCNLKTHKLQKVFNWMQAAIKVTATSDSSFHEL